MQMLMNKLKNKQKILFIFNEKNKIKIYKFLLSNKFINFNF